MTNIGLGMTNIQTLSWSPARLSWQSARAGAQMPFQCFKRPSSRNCGRWSYLLRIRAAV